MLSHYLLDVLLSYGPMEENEIQHDESLGQDLKSG